MQARMRQLMIDRVNEQDNAANRPSFSAGALIHPQYGRGAFIHPQYGGKDNIHIDAFIHPVEGDGEYIESLYGNGMYAGEYIEEVYGEGKKQGKKSGARATVTRGIKRHGLAKYKQLLGARENKARLQHERCKKELEILEGEGRKKRVRKAGAIAHPGVLKRGVLKLKDRSLQY